MIITKTPLRISFFGGGTDYPAHFLKHGGATLAAAIDKYTYITVSPLNEFFDHRIGIYYSRTELVNSIDEIQHPSIRECLRHMGIDKNVEIHVALDLPSRTGLGSSSSFTAGLLKALYAYKGKIVSAHQLASETVHVEQEMIKERVGCQDQFSCAYGGLHHFQFRKDGTVVADPLVVPASRLTGLNDRLLLFYTGIRRTAHEVVAEQLTRTSSGQLDNELAAMGALVDRGIEVLSGDCPLQPFGELLHESWMLKRKCSTKVTNPGLDEIYERARKAGAVGGKLLGAGGGGFFLFFVEPQQQLAVRAALADLREVDFHFENGGSTVIFYRAVQ